MTDMKDRVIRAMLDVHSGAAIGKAAAEVGISTHTLRGRVDHHFGGPKILRGLSEKDMLDRLSGDDMPSRSCMNCGRLFSDHKNMRMCQSCRRNVDTYHDGWV